MERDREETVEADNVEWLNKPVMEERFDFIRLACKHKNRKSNSETLENSNIEDYGQGKNV